MSINADGTLVIDPSWLNEHTSMKDQFQNWFGVDCPNLENLDPWTLHMLGYFFTELKPTTIFFRGTNHVLGFFIECQQGEPIPSKPYIFVIAKDKEKIHAFEDSWDHQYAKAPKEWTEEVDSVMKRWNDLNIPKCSCNHAQMPPPQTKCRCM